MLQANLSVKALKSSSLTGLTYWKNQETDGVTDGGPKNKVVENRLLSILSINQTDGRTSSKMKAPLSLSLWVSSHCSTSCAWWSSQPPSVACLMTTVSHFSSCVRYPCRATAAAVARWMPDVQLILGPLVVSMVKMKLDTKEQGITCSSSKKKSDQDATRAAGCPFICRNASCQSGRSKIW